MRCPYLMKLVEPTCFATEVPYVPTYVQLEEYCQRKDFIQCPFCRTFMKKEKHRMRMIHDSKYH
jgi:hypothetical protein